MHSWTNYFQLIENKTQQQFVIVDFFLKFFNAIFSFFAIVSERYF